MLNRLSRNALYKQLKIYLDNNDEGDDKLSDYVGSIISMIFALVGIIFIIGLTYFVAKWYAGRMGSATGGKYIRIVERLPVSRSGAILIIDIGGRQYMVGVSDQRVDIMTEIDDPIPISKDKDFGEGVFKKIAADQCKALADGIKRRRGGGR